MSTDDVKDDMMRLKTEFSAFCKDREFIDKALEPFIYLFFSSAFQSEYFQCLFAQMSLKTGRSGGFRSRVMMEEEFQRLRKICITRPSVRPSVT